MGSGAHGRSFHLFPRLPTELRLIIRQNFRVHSSESVKKSLEDKLAKEFGAQAVKELPRLCPAIMFRLCPHFSNHAFRPREHRRR